jgi:hypothetical protein
MMKISIWQQFSSNHSANFELVGQFRTVEEAEKAYATLLDILTVIAQYNEGNIERENPTFAEVEFGKEYGFEWQERVDWLWEVAEVEENLGRFENWVWVASVSNQPYNSGSYLNIQKIMERLNANTWISEELGRGGEFGVNLTCEFKDPAQLNTLFEALEVHFTPISKYNPFIFELFNEWDIWQVASYKKADGQLILNDIRFSRAGENLPAFIQYLRENGAENIQYSFQKIR